MTPKQVDLIQSTFAQVAPNAELAAHIFYSHLFELEPSLRPMFRGNMKEQGKKLMDTLKVVVASLRDIDRIVPAVRALGARHNNYGVKDEHYDTVGAALLWTLSFALGDTFTDEAREAWAAAYNLLASVMKEAQAEAAVA